MAQVIWTEPALSDLDAVADYIALDNPAAAKELVRKVFRRVEQLAEHPKIGSKPQELKGWRYRQIVERPCRVFYRIDGARVYVLCFMRGERLLGRRMLSVRDKKLKNESAE